MNSFLQAGLALLTGFALGAYMFLGGYIRGPVSPSSNIPVLKKVAFLPPLAREINFSSSLLCSVNLGQMKDLRHRPFFKTAHKGPVIRITFGSAVLGLSLREGRIVPLPSYEDPPLFGLDMYDGRPWVSLRL